MNHFNQDGHLTEEMISRYSEALRLNRQEGIPEAVREHIAGCTQCHQEAIELYSIIAKVDYSDLEVKSEPKTKSTGNRWWRMSMIALLAVLAFLFYRELDQKEETPRPQKLEELSPANPNQQSQEAPGTPILEEESPTPKEPETEEAQPKEKPKVIYADNFIPSDNLESMIGGTLRSSGYKINAPDNEASYKVKESITFDIDMTIQEPYTIVVLDNRENELLRASPEEASFQFDQSLPPGLYYWKLETEEELLHVGKFSVRK